MKRFGVAGIALSSSMVYLISCMFLGFWALKLLRRKESEEIESSVKVSFPVNTMEKTE